MTLQQVQNFMLYRVYSNYTPQQAAANPFICLASCWLVNPSYCPPLTEYRDHLRIAFYLRRLTAQGYKDPALCNYFCARECPIGRKYVPQIAPRSLSEIVLEMLASLNGMQAKRDRLIEITSNGRVDDHEVEDFVKIQESLAKISETAEALRLWEEQMLAEGKINMDLYKQFRGEKRKG